MTGRVSRMRGLTPDVEMSLIGYVVAAGVTLLLLPILPFVAVIAAVLKLFGGREPDRPAAQ